jgi:hypothetical protein
MKSSQKKDLRSGPVSSTRPNDEFDLPRDEELCEKESLQDTLVKLYNEIEAGFDAQGQRSDNIADYWNCYNTRLDHNQFYSGNSQIYVPLVTDAVNARVTRFSNQIFPQNGRFVDVITEDKEVPHASMALLEYYIRKTNMQTDIIPPLLRSGDIEGQYTVYVDWEITEKEVATREEKAPLLDAKVVDPTKTVYEIVEKTIKEGKPRVEVISDVNLLVLPATASSIEAALACGGSVTVLRKWSKSKIEQMIADKEIDKARGKALLKEMNQPKKFNRGKDTAKSMVDAAGIKDNGSGIKTVQVYETWTYLTMGKKRRIHRMFFAGVDKCLSCKRNPYWSDNVPIISCPVEKVNGSFKGKSKIEPVATFQYAANDIVNEGMDSAAYAMMPIIMTDPEKNPRIGSLVLSLAAIWETSPKDTQFASFPQLWKDAFEIVAAARAQVFQTLSVNPAQITQATSKKKPSQADVANEQQIDILTTAGAVTIIEGGILTPILHRFLELDHQFRDKKLTIMQHGEMGIRATMQEVDPIQMHKKHYIKWFGVEAARNAQQIQQMIAALNVLRGIPPQMYPGYRMEMAPAIVQIVESAFGPRLAPLTFVNVRDQISVDPQLENELLESGMDIDPHMGDDIQKHMQAHLQALQATGDPHGTIRAHLQKHQMMGMLMMSQAQQQGQGMPGAPGGAGPGLPGQPRPGAQPRNPRAQQPPGAIHRDNMVDPRAMPQ